MNVIKLAAYNMTNLNKITNLSSNQCNSLNFLGSVYIVLLGLSLVLNTIAAGIFKKTYKFRSKLDIFFFVMTVINVVETINEFLFTIPNMFLCR